MTQEMADEWNAKLEKLDARIARWKKLAEDDDWAFIIKCHAIIEIFFTEMLVENLGKKEITSVVEHLPLSDSRIGKLALADSIVVLSKHHRTFIRKFSELRNSLVHNTDDFDFLCANHFGSLNSENSKVWKQIFTEILGKRLPVDWEKSMFPSQARELLWMTVLEMVVLCVRHQLAPMGRRWGLEIGKDGFAVEDTPASSST